MTHPYGCLQGSPRVSSPAENLWVFESIEVCLVERLATLPVEAQPVGRMDSRELTGGSLKDTVGSSLVPLLTVAFFCGVWVPLFLNGC